MTGTAASLVFDAGRVRFIREIEFRIQTAGYRSTGWRASRAITIVSAARRCADLGITAEKLDRYWWRDLANNAGPAFADELEGSIDRCKIRVRETSWGWKLPRGCPNGASR